MSGNVRQWCHDWHSEEYYEKCEKQGLVVNPTGPLEGFRRVLRGGGWSLSFEVCRVWNRFDAGPQFRFYDVGFRLALSL